MKFLTIQTALDLPIELFHDDGSSKSTNRQTDRRQLQSFLGFKLFKEYKNINATPIKTNQPTTKSKVNLTFVCLQLHNVTSSGTVRFC
jgi:hypothetical protein